MITLTTTKVLMSILLINGSSFLLSGVDQKECQLFAAYIEQRGNAPILYYDAKEVGIAVKVVCFASGEEH